MPPLRYPFTQDALDAARADLEREGGTMEDAIRAWLREERFGLERSDTNPHDGTPVQPQARLVGPWLDV